MNMVATYFLTTQITSTSVPCGKTLSCEPHATLSNHFPPLSTTYGLIIAHFSLKSNGKFRIIFVFSSILPYGFYIEYKISPHFCGGIFTVSSLFRHSAGPDIPRPTGPVRDSGGKSPPDHLPRARRFSFSLSSSMRSFNVSI